jgi:3',5'-nucleoside bisphosphate phosphatase
LIDLHSHTNESDGTFSPSQLIEEARRVGVRTLGITDHDTFAGYDKAVPMARAAGVELVCGIELSTKLPGGLHGGRSVHLLGYFLGEDGPAPEFREWILDMQAARRDRNVRLIARLRELEIDITLEEVQARSGGLTARPHFAQVMLEKGYVATLQQAFDQYLDESATGYVYRREPLFAEGVELIRKAGGITSLAHPVRVPGDLRTLMPELCATGLNAIEVFHSDHSPAQTELYRGLAGEYGLLVTGGSDFHGSAKPGLCLGTGRNRNLRIPGDLLDRLKDIASSRRPAISFSGTGERVGVSRCFQAEAER